MTVRRTGSPQPGCWASCAPDRTADAVEAVDEHVKRGASISSVWDGIHCGAAELQLRVPNIVSLHAVTTTHAIHFAFRTTEDARMRRMLMCRTRR